MDQVEKLGISAIIDAPEKLAKESDLQLRRLHRRVFQLSANIKAGEKRAVSLADLRAARDPGSDSVYRAGSHSPHR